MEKQVSEISRRHLVVSALALSALKASAQSSNYPDRPIRFVVPFAPGGNADILGRILGEELARTMGQPFVIDNRPGGSNIIGTQFAVRSAPDGYTLLMVSTSHTVNPSLFGKELPYDTYKEFAGVAKVGSTPMVLVANPGLGVNTVQELIAKAKARPGAINFASSGNGSPAHMAGELLNAMAGIKLAHIPYKGTAQGTTDALSGQVQLAFPSLSSVGEMIRTGKLRALGLTTSKRSPIAPETPTIAETVHGYEASIWNGVVVPQGVPKAIVARLNKEILKVLGMPSVRERLAKIGVDVDGSAPAQFDAFIAGEIKKWSRITQSGNIKVDMVR